MVFNANFGIRTLVVIGSDYIGSCKSNYHTITTMTRQVISSMAFYNVGHENSDPISK